MGVNVNFTCKGCGERRHLDQEQSALYLAGLFPVRCEGCGDLRPGNMERHPQIYNYYHSLTA